MLSAPSAPLAPVFEPKRYFMMLLALTVAILFLSHCIFLPILSPFFHCASWLTHALSLIVSFSLSLVLTETFQEKDNNGLLKVLFFNPNDPANAMSTEKNQVSTNLFHFQEQKVIFFSELQKNSLPLRTLDSSNSDTPSETISHSLSPICK